MVLITFYCGGQHFVIVIKSGLFFYSENNKHKFRLKNICSKEYSLEEEKPKIVCLSRSLLL